MDFRTRGRRESRKARKVQKRESACMLELRSPRRSVGSSYLRFPISSKGTKQSLSPSLSSSSLKFELTIRSPSLLHPLLPTDVYASLVDTLEDLLLPPSSRPTPPPSSNSDVDAPSPPVLIYGFGLRYGLTQVVEELGVYTSPGSIWYTKNQAMAGVDGGWEGRGADVVVFGTCEIESALLLPPLVFLPHAEAHRVVSTLSSSYQHEELLGGAVEDLASSSSRSKIQPDLHRSCVLLLPLLLLFLSLEDSSKLTLHLSDNAGDFGWAEKYSGDWARVGALRILPISQQCALSLVLAPPLFELLS